MQIIIKTTKGNAVVMSAKNALILKSKAKLTKKGEPTKKGYYALIDASDKVIVEWFSTADHARIYAREILGYEDSTLQGTPVTSENFKEVKASLAFKKVDDTAEFEKLLESENKELENIEGESLNDIQDKFLKMLVGDNQC